MCGRTAFQTRTGAWIVRAAAILALSAAAPAAWAIGILAPTDPGLPPLGLKSHKVDVQIVDQVAHTHIEQVFYNDTNRQLEAHYLFPVPKGAQITDFVLYMNGEPVHAEVVEREKARAIYEDIVRRMRDPGLLEYLDWDVRRVRVFPIPAHGDQKIEVEYAQTLELDGTAAQYQYPTRIGRYAAGGVSPQTGDFQFKFRIESAIPIKTVYSPTHEFTIERQGEDKASGTLRGENWDDRDVTVVYTLSKDLIGLSALTYRDNPDEPGYFMALISPKVEIDQKTIQPKAVTFVIDTSGSMAKDDKIAQARAALDYCLAQLRPADSFNIVRFSSDVETFRNGLVEAAEDNVRLARHWVEQLQAKGGTNIDDALAAALASNPPEGMTHVVILMTDGVPTVGETRMEAILGNLEQHNNAGLRVFTFGLGYDVNAPLLDGIASDTRAVAGYIKPEENMEVPVSRFFDKASNPVLTGLSLIFDGGDVVDLYPRDLPDLFAGSQLIVFGRYKAPGGVGISLQGNLEGETRTFEYETRFPPEDLKSKYIEPLWAQRKVGYLLEQIRRNGESDEVVQEVIALAKEYGMVTPYTSFLVTEDEALAQAPVPRRSAPLEQARPMPVDRPAPGPYFYGGGAMGGRGGAAAPAARTRGDVGMSEAASQPMDRGAIPNSDALSLQSMEAKTGRQAVAASEAIALYKAADKEASAPASARASGRAFVRANGVWIDQSLEKREQTLKIKFLSDAYFSLLELRPDLKEALSLGDAVEIRLNATTVLIIGAEGKETLEDADKDLLKKTAPEK